MEKKPFRPYVPADQNPPEFTPVSVITGVLLAVVFGGANAYLGLRVGLTVSASIPAAVLSMGILRMVLRRSSILENNMAQTIGSAGESVAAGAIFTLPALFMWAEEGLCQPPTLPEAGLITLCGGALGVLMMVPLRRTLIVGEHGVLAYPEGQACAQVLMAGEEGGARASAVFAGLAVAAVYKFAAEGWKLFPAEVDWAFSAYPGGGFGLDVLPALAGVGYICGARVSSYLFAGGTMAWLALMPLIALFGGGTVLFPATVSVAELLAREGTWGLWSSYVKYIGAGAVAAGGILSLVKSLPLILRTFREAVGGYGRGDAGTLRTERDLSPNVLTAGVLAAAAALWLSPAIPLNLFTALLVVVFAFFFAAVSSRMVGLIGASNNPVSGMTIATLLIASLVLKAAGTAGVQGMVTAVTIGAVICITASVAGDTSQDLKTGFLVGATPRKQQIGELIGCCVSAAAIGAILYLLNAAWSYGSKELPAAQATLMKLVVEGVMGGDLPWALVFIGVFLALTMEVLGTPVLPVAIGLYLPVHLSAPIMAGGLVRWLVERRKYDAPAARERCVRSGILYASGLIAGEGVVGILLAVLAVVQTGGGSLGALLDLSGRFHLGNGGALVCFAGLLASLYGFARRGERD